MIFDIPVYTNIKILHKMCCQKELNLGTSKSMMNFQIIMTKPKLKP